jgi:outer membrane protein assembly factor BamB
MLFFRDWNGVFHANNLLSKKEIWRFDTKNEQKFEYWVNAILTQPAYDNGSVFFTGRSCRLFALDAESGQVNWIHKSPIDSWLCDSPVLYRDQLFLGSSDYHSIQSIDVVTGNLNWKTELVCWIWGNALVTPEGLYC